MECWFDDGDDLIDNISPGKKQERFQYTIVANIRQWTGQAILPVRYDTYDLFRRGRIKR